MERNPSNASVSPSSLSPPPDRPQVIKGAVNTILVCWADSPTIFEMNHPELCKEMADSWTHVFPEIAVYVRPATAHSVDS